MFGRPLTIKMCGLTRDYVDFYHVVANPKMLILQNICSWITLAFLTSHLFLNLRVPSPALAPTPSPTAVAPAPSTEAKCSTDRWDAVALRGAQQIVAGTQGTMKYTSAMSFTNIVYYILYIYIICIEIPYNYVSNDVYNIWRTYRYSVIVYIYILYIYIYSVCIVCIYIYIHI